MTDINRELAEDAAEDYSDDPVSRKWFIFGWLAFCDGGDLNMPKDENGYYPWALDGYIAARDAPE